jgi:hypothetical protein
MHPPAQPNKSKSVGLVGESRVALLMLELCCSWAFTPGEEILPRCELINKETQNERKEYEINKYEKNKFENEMDHDDSGHGGLDGHRLRTAGDSDYRINIL